MTRLVALPFAVMLLATAASAACAPKSRVAAPAPFPSAPARAPGAIPSPIVTTALALRGTPYRLGGDEPTRGFDCSGLVRYVLSQHAIRAPRTVTEQFGLGRPVRPSDIQPGDLLFFTTIAPGASHVGIATSAHEFLHAPSSGGVVRIDRVDSPYWRARWIGAKRLN